MSKAGSTKKSDVLVTVEHASRTTVHVGSTLGPLYHDRIAKVIRSTVKPLGGKVKVTAEDNGAPDWVVRARTETACRRLNQQEG